MDCFLPFHSLMASVSKRGEKQPVPLFSHTVETVLPRPKDRKGKVSEGMMPNFVPYLEKAYAKLQGSYNLVRNCEHEHGQTAIVLEELTGGLVDIIALSQWAPALFERNLALSADEEGKEVEKVNKAHKRALACMGEFFLAHFYRSRDEEDEMKVRDLLDTDMSKRWSRQSLKRCERTKATCLGCVFSSNDSHPSERLRTGAEHDHILMVLILLFLYLNACLFVCFYCL